MNMRSIGENWKRVPKKSRKWVWIALAAVLVIVLAAVNADTVIQVGEVDEEVDEFGLLISSSVSIGNKNYISVSDQEVRRHGLQVKSVEGLTKIEEADREAYVYPNKKYPNLIVVARNEEPKVYAFWCFEEEPETTEEILDVYGMTGASAIRKINIRSRDGKVDVTVRGRRARKQFVEAIKSGTPMWRYGLRESYNTYYVDIYLSNGFVCETVCWRESAASEEIAIGMVECRCEGIYNWVLKQVGVD